MTLPPSSDQVWKDILLGKTRYNFEFLALKILLGRLIMQVEANPSPGTLQKCADEMANLLAKNAHLPSAKRDIQKIKGV
jgi:hypothetical protein